MRSFIHILTAFLFLSGSTGICDSGKPTPTLFQARGFHKGICYHEMAALNCSKLCTMTLFPKTQAELSMRIPEAPPRLRQAPGHFFDIKFKIVNDSGNEAQVLDWKPATFEALKSKIARSNGMAVSSPCGK